MTKGTGYLGSDTLQVSTANQELVPSKPQQSWTNGYRLLKFSFDNKQNVTVILNGEATIFLEAGQGFEIGYEDVPVTSFIIVEVGVSFNWIAIY